MVVERRVGIQKIRLGETFIKVGRSSHYAMVVEALKLSFLDDHID